MCWDGMIDKVPQVKSCCCCCKVETGSKVIAWFGLIASLLGLVTTSIGLAGLIAIVSQNKGDDQDKHEVATTVGIAILVVSLLYLIFFFLMALLLLFGLYKEDMEKVKLWLIVNICLFLFGIVVSGFHIYFVTTSADKSGIAVTVMTTIIQILLTLYMICVVKSHYYNKTRDVESVSP